MGLVPDGAGVRVGITKDLNGHMIGVTVGETVIPPHRRSIKETAVLTLQGVVLILKEIRN